MKLFQAVHLCLCIYLAVGLTLAQTPADHVLAPGDQLELFIYGLPRLERNYTIRRDGCFLVPTLGTVDAAGKTMGQLQSELDLLLKRRLKNPKFSLGLISEAPKKITIMGEVERPGAYDVLAGSTLFELIAHAGGPKPLADPEAALLTRARTGQQERIQLTGASIESLGIQSGDVLQMQLGIRVNVAGEVAQPGLVAVSQTSGDPFQALSRAGGAKPNAALKRVLVFRSSREEAITIDLSPAHDALPEEARQLQEGDTLIVPQRQAIVLQKEPKPIPLQGGETVLDVVIRAGVGQNLDAVTLVRQQDTASLVEATPDTLDVARLKPERIDLTRYFENHDTSVLLPVYDGDIVLVPDDEPFDLLRVLSLALTPLQLLLSFRYLGF